LRQAYDYWQDQPGNEPIFYVGPEKKRKEEFDNYPHSNSPDVFSLNTASPSLMLFFELTQNNQQFN
jgi:hypothetical protein